MGMSNLKTTKKTS